MTYTYAILELSKSAYDEIRIRLEVAGYTDQFHENKSDTENPIIDMHGIAVSLTDEIDE